MEQITSFRLDKKNLEFLNKFSKEERISKGETLRELLLNGRLMLGIKLYKEKKASIGKSSEIAGVSISEFMDNLSEFGLNSNLTLEDFKLSLINAKKLKLN